MAPDQEIIRELWERSSNDEAIEILGAVAQRRGLDRPDAALLERLRTAHRAATSAEDLGKPLVICDKSLVCYACGHDKFRQRGGEFNSALAGLFGLEGSERTPRCAICTRCGHMHWFA
jgi:hypothetical protein